MREVTYYETVDGEVWKEKADALLHEKILDIVADIMAPLPKKPNNVDFDNGHGYLQHDMEQFLTIRRHLAQLAMQYIEIPRNSWNFSVLEQTAMDPLSIHPEYFWKVIGEQRTLKGINTAWFNIGLCTDKEGRQWGQMYYADHPENAKSMKVWNA